MKELLNKNNAYWLPCWHDRAQQILKETWPHFKCSYIIYYAIKFQDELCHKLFSEIYMIYQLVSFNSINSWQNIISIRQGKQNNRCWIQMYKNCLTRSQNSPLYILRQCQTLMLRTAQQSELPTLWKQWGTKQEVRSIITNSQNFSQGRFQASNCERT